MTELSEFYKARGAIHWGTQNMDGTPHFAYYHAPRRLSFTWNGFAESPIEISYDGYGEPVYAEIPASDFYESDLMIKSLEFDATKPEPLHSLEAFKLTCDAWIVQHPHESWEND